MAEGDRSYTGDDHAGSITAIRWNRTGCADRGVGRRRGAGNRENAASGSRGRWPYGCHGERPRSGNGGTLRYQSSEWYRPGGDPGSERSGTVSMIDHYLEQLNEPQREAVLENEHPLLVLAGAGSGKTRVITTKIAYAIDVLNVKPWEILAVTFTNRAAKEMRDRVEQMVENGDASDIQIRTFHSFGAWLLRRYGASIGLSSSFSIYDDDDSLSLLASCFPESKKTELAPVAKAISLAKDMGLSPESPTLSQFRRDGEFRNQFTQYEKRLRQVGNVDFADLIGLSIELLDTDSSVRSMVHRRFRMVLVDEYQDSNIAQF